MQKHIIKENEAREIDSENQAVLNLHNPSSQQWEPIFLVQQAILFITSQNLLEIILISTKNKKSNLNNVFLGSREINPR